MKTVTPPSPSNVSRKIRVLIAEDSNAVRALLVSILTADHEIEVVGEARDGAEVVRLAERMHPDVITMDIHMPVMDGMEATAEIMSRNPTPIVIVSSAVNKHDLEMSLQATRVGALTALTKPEHPGSPNFDKYASDLIYMVKAMSQVKVVRRWKKPGIAARRESTKVYHPTSAEPINVTGEWPAAVIPDKRFTLIAIATSTGGPAALQKLFSSLPKDFALPILVVQHIATGFVEALADWLNKSCPIQVKLAENGEAIRGGVVYLGPDGRHLGVRKGRIILSEGAPVGGFLPSGTELFRSVAHDCGASALGLILTGMGRDGVDGLRDLQKAGGYIIAQDEATSVVYGMPQEAVKAGVANQVLPLEAIGPALARLR